MATTYNEPRYGGEFLVSEANGDLSRETVVVAMGQNLKAGQPYAKLNNKAVAINPAGNDGSQTAAGFSYANCDATAGDQKAAAIVREAEYNESLVVWGSLTAPQIATAKTQLAAQNLIARRGI